MFNTVKFTGILIFLVVLTLLTVDFLTLYAANSRLTSGITNATDTALAVNIDRGATQYGEVKSYEEERVREVFQTTLASELNLQTITANNKIFQHGVEITDLQVEPRADGTPSVYANIRASLDTVLMGRLLSADDEGYVLTVDSYATEADFLYLWK